MSTTKRKINKNDSDSSIASDLENNSSTNSDSSSEHSDTYASSNNNYEEELTEETYINTTNMSVIPQRGRPKKNNLHMHREIRPNYYQQNIYENPYDHANYRPNLDENPYRNPENRNPESFVDLNNLYFHNNPYSNPYSNNPYSNTPYSNTPYSNFHNQSYSNFIYNSYQQNAAIEENIYRKRHKQENMEDLLEKTRKRREMDREKSFRKTKQVVDSESAEYFEEETVTEVDVIEKILCIIKYKEETKCLVKRRFYSYLHNFWCDLSEMTTQTSVLKYKNFLKKHKSRILEVKRSELETTEIFNNLETEKNSEKEENLEIEIFGTEPLLNPELIEIERILIIGSPKKLGIDFEFNAQEEEIVYNGYGGLDFLSNKKEKIEEKSDFSEKTEDKKYVYLIKWKGITVDLSTFEEYSYIYKLKGFKEALKLYERRKNYKESEKGIFDKPKISEQREIEKFESIKEGEEKMSLRSYQLEGLNWLLNRWYFNQSCIMADEMGLGKTVQSVSLVRTLFEMGYKNKVLVVAPLSTLPHWEREFIRWSHLNVTILHGNKDARDVLLSYECPTSDVILTTYEMAMCSFKPDTYFSTFGVGIFDEAHRLKNSNSKANRFFSKLTFGFKLLLSGTPLQNNLTELWSLLNFIDSSKFPNSSDFLKTYRLEKTEDVERLQNTLRPLMLRRMKDDVESIPLKEETIVEVELTMIQKRFYRAILYKNREYFQQYQNIKKRQEPSFVNIMMELRKCCIHPFLIKGAEEIILNDKSYTESISKYVDSEYFNILIQSSGKLVFLDKLLDKMFNEKSGKILIFSQMTKCLDLVGLYLRHRNYKFERIDGSIKKEDRQEAIDRFSNSAIEDSFVFLLCTRAGGVGINLTAANTCVIFDSDWNPQNDLQAQARCHRIGQTEQVKIYRLVTRNTYEREMFDRASIKLGLDRAVLQKDLKQSFNELTTVENLLKKGAYGVLMENDTINEQFISEDIEKMLSNRTQVISHERNAGHIFSKASFQVEEDINDEKFWEDLLSEKKNKERDNQIRKQMRRLSRELDLLKEQQVYKKCLEQIILEKQKIIEKEEKIDKKLGAEIVIFVMLYVTRYGIKSLISLKEICKGLELIQIIPRISYLASESIVDKYKDDYLVNTKIDDIKNIKEEKDSNNIKEDGLKKIIYELDVKDLEEVTTKIELPENYSRTNPPRNLNTSVLKTFNSFYLIRLQAYNLLKNYTSKMSLFHQKGASLKEDEELVNYVLENGYDNFPTAVYENTSKLFKGKRPEELNQRIRKIILSLHSQIQKVDLNEIALDFGPENELNSEFIKEKCSLQNYTLFLNEIIKKGNDLLLSRLEKKNKKIKSSGYTRINEIEKLVYYRYRLFIDMKGRKGDRLKRELREGIEKYIKNSGKTKDEILQLMKEAQKE